MKSFVEILVCLAVFVSVILSPVGTSLATNVGIDSDNHNLNTMSRNLDNTNLSLYYNEYLLTTTGWYNSPVVYSSSFETYVVYSEEESDNTFTTYLYSNKTGNEVIGQYQYDVQFDIAKDTFNRLYILIASFDHLTLKIKDGDSWSSEVLPDESGFVGYKLLVTSDPIATVHVFQHGTENSGKQAVLHMWRYVLDTPVQPKWNSEIIYESDLSIDPIIGTLYNNDIYICFGLRTRYGQSGTERIVMGKYSNNEWNFYNVSYFSGYGVSRQGIVVFNNKIYIAYFNDTQLFCASASVTEPSKWENTLIYQTPPNPNDTEYCIRRSMLTNNNKHMYLFMDVTTTTSEIAPDMWKYDKNNDIWIDLNIDIPQFLSYNYSGRLYGAQSLYYDSVIIDGSGLWHITCSNSSFAYYLYGHFYNDDTLENNDIISNARALTPGTYTDLVCGDPDFYTVNVSSGYDLDVDVDVSSGPPIASFLYPSGHMDDNMSSTALSSHLYVHPVMNDSEYYISIFPSSAGISNYTLTITLTKNNSIGQPPAADFTVLPSIIYANTTVLFDASLTTDPDEPLSNLVFRWDFEGDGVWDTDYLSSPSAEHMYSLPGQYNVTLEARDSVGFLSECSKYISVLKENMPPTAGFTYSPSAPLAMEAITFTDTSTDDLGLASWHWDFGDGSGSTERNASHAYDAPGTYTVTLKVTDAGGYTDSFSNNITVGNNPPVIDSVSFTQGEAYSGDSILFTAVASDIDGSITSYLWDFGDGGAGTGESAAHAYALPGNYTITLTVTDDFGAEVSRYVNITVLNRLPEVAIVSDSDGIVGDEMAFKADASDSDGTIVSCVWDFGDGSNGTGCNSSHTYDRAGEYTVTLTVTDDFGGAATTSTVVHVSPRPESSGNGGDNTPGLSGFTAMVAMLLGVIAATAYVFIFRRET